MKLLRYGPAGAELPGILDKDGKIRDLSSMVPDIDLRTVGLDRLLGLKRIDPASLPVIRDDVRIGVPVANVGKFVAIGLNYRDHAIEANLEIPTEPVVFMKATSCLSGPNDDIVVPRSAKKVDWEVELGIVIGATARSVDESTASRYIAGYTLVNDVSERSYQLERGGTWDKGKSFDSFGPVGPYLVTADELSDPQNLEMWLEVNGVRKQHGNTRTMIFSCAKLVSYVSEVMTLFPGDIITTGTPPGVGMGMSPPQYLNPGDTVRLEIHPLGVQQQRVVSYKAEN